MSTLLEKFDYDRPTTWDQLTQLVQDYQQQGRKFAFAAGGTNLIPQLKVKSFSLDNMISLAGLTELNRIERQGDRLVIGALTPLCDIVTSDLITEYLPTLAEAAHKVASPQIRNRATLGGNIMVDNRCIYINQSTLNRGCHAPCFKADGDICHLVKSAKRGDETLCQARFVSDTAPILLLLGAELRLVGPDGTRQIQLDELYLNDGIISRSLKPGELISHIDIKIPHRSHFHYEKLTIRKALDFPSLGVAVSLCDGDLGVALTGLNVRPGLFRAKSADYDTFEDMVVDVTEQAMGFAVTYQQDFFPRAYRKSMIPVFIRRGIDAILKETTP